MKLPLLCPLAVACIVLSDCGGRNTKITYKESDDESIHQRVVAMYNSTPVDSCINLERLAVDQLRKGIAPESGFEILSYMGYLQSRAGNYREALDYMQEAADSLRSMPADSVDSEDKVKFLGNLANLYSRFGLYDESLQKNEEAMDIARESVPLRVADLWRMRGTCYDLQHKNDSAYNCYVEAIRSSYEIEDSVLRPIAIAFNRCAMAWHYIENPDFAPDSIPEAVKVLEQHFEGNLASTNMVFAGRGRFLMGEREIGLELMRKGIDAGRSQNDESLEYWLRFLSRSYAEARDSRLFDIYQEATDLHDTIMARRRDDVLLGKDFQYRTLEMRAERDSLADKVTISRQHSLLIVIVGLMLLSTVTTFFIGKTRRQRRMIKEDRERVETLLADRMLLNSKVERLNAEIRAGAHSESERTLLSAVILDKESEYEFRKLFGNIHPGFIEHLRRDYPSLTPGNELLCMLIRMRKNNDEIALALGISRESVTTSRYRLRSRLNLSKDQDLNEFIQSL